MSLLNMAPSPEHDNEPKAPDKSDNKTGEGVELRTGDDFLEDHVSSPRTGDLQETSVSTLDDSQLKALLDEAITYKTPKDREGKSQIFKELLQEAEEDERNARAASASGPQLARYYNTAAARRHRNSTSRRENPSSSVSARLTHGGSLQDLAQPDLYADVVPSSHGAARRAANSRRRAAAAGHHHSGGHVVSVSARQREGGSLPSNVNAGATYDRQLFDTDDTSRCGRRKTAVKSTCTSTGPTKPTTACSKEKKMVEATETAALTTSTTTVRPEYTVVELGQDADLEETRALLSQDRTPVASYNSTSQCTTVPAEVKLEANVATWSSENEQQTVASAAAQMHVASIRADVNEDRSTATVTAAQGDSGFGSSASTYHQQQQNALEEAIQPHRLPRLRYTSRATLELDGIGGAITTSNTSTVVATSSVDKSITFPQLHQHTDAPALQLEGDYNSVRCIVESTSGSAATAGALTSAAAAATGETQPSRQQMTPSLSQAGPTSTLVPAQYRLLSVANPKLIHGVDRYHSEKKGLDENGNSVNTTSTALLDAKKKKKSKADRKVTVLSSEKIEGHRADIIESIDLLVKYIEDGPIGGTSTPGKGGGSKPHHHHHHHHNVKVTGSSKQHLQQQNNKNAQQPPPQQQQQQVDGKRRTRVKSKSEQGVVKKSNSLEEISKTKLEDLMADDVSKCVRARVKKQSTSEDGDRRSWGTEDGQQYICGKISTTVYEPQVKEDSYTSLNILAPETAEFHVVTKKKKSKKRRSSSGGRHNHHLFSTSAADDAQKLINHTVNHAYQQVSTRADHQHNHHHHHQKHHHQVREHHHNRNSVFAQEAESVPARRKSACSVPPSDKSNDSSDVDSVHSLPAAVHTHSTECAASETVDKQTLTSYADIARTSGGAPGLPVVSTSSASSNCSSHSGGSSGNVFIQQQQQVQPPVSTTWKPVQQQPPPSQQTIPPAKNHTVLLRAEHFPELCETSPLDEFPSLDQLQVSAPRVTLPGSKWTQVTSSNQQHQHQQQPTIRVVVNSNCCKEPPVTCQVKKEPSARLPAAAAVNSVTHKPPASVQRQQPPAPLPPLLLQKPVKSPPAAAPLVTDVKYCDMNPRLNSVVTCKKLTPPAAAVPCVRRSHAPAPRPAVIILDDESNANGPVTSSSDPIQVSGLTFGFELNEQLLNNSAPLLVSGEATPRSLSPLAAAPPPGDKYSAVLVNNTSGSAAAGATAALDAGSAPGDRFTARYLVPHSHTDITDTYNHDKIVTYVGLAWEDVVHQSNGKVQYYNGQ